MPQPELNRIYLGDCLEVMNTWPDSFLDTVLADPPYNIGYRYDGFRDNTRPSIYQAQQLQLVKESIRLLKPGGSLLYLNLPEFCSDLWHRCKTIRNLVRWDMMFWVQNKHTTNPAGRLRQSSRIWLWFTKSGRPPVFNAEFVKDMYRNPSDARVKLCEQNGRFPVWRDFFQFEPVKNVCPAKTDHPCQLPLKMVRGLLGMVTPKNGIVLDPYLGSGTTAVACVLEGFRFCGIEISPAYVKMAEARIAQEMAQVKMF